MERTTVYLILIASGFLKICSEPPAIYIHTYELCTIMQTELKSLPSELIIREKNLQRALKLKFCRINVNLIWGRRF